MGQKTSYHLSVSLHDQILEIDVKGEIDRSAVEQLHAEVIAVAQGKQAKALLCDISGLNGRFDEFGEAYFRVRSIPPEVGKMLLALVDTSTNEPYQSFYMTTASNVGQTLRWFPDKKAARAWLIESIAEQKKGIGG